MRVAGVAAVRVGVRVAVRPVWGAGMAGAKERSGYH